MKSIIALIAVIYCVSAATLFDNIDNYDNCMLLNNDNMSLMWKIDGQTIHFSLAGKTTGWIAVGINKNNNAAMVGSDAIICSVLGDGTVNAQDSWMSAKSTCVGSSGVCPDTSDSGTNDVTVVSGVEDAINGITVVEFSRSLDTGDTYDTVISNTEQYFVYAMSTSDTISQHNAGNDYFQLNAFTTQTCGSCSAGYTCNKGCCVPQATTTGSPSSASTLAGSVAMVAVASAGLLL